MERSVRRRLGPSRRHNILSAGARLRQIQLPYNWSGQLVRWQRRPHIAQAAARSLRPAVGHHKPAGTMVASGSFLHRAWNPTASKLAGTAPRCIHARSILNRATKLRSLQAAQCAANCEKCVIAVFGASSNLALDNPPRPASIHGATRRLGVPALRSSIACRDRRIPRAVNRRHAARASHRGEPPARSSRAT